MTRFTDEIAVVVDMVRQLKGATRKETKREKLQRRQDNRAAKEKISTFVVPVLVAILIAVAVFIYLAARK